MLVLLKDFKSAIQSAFFIVRMQVSSRTQMFSNSLYADFFMEIHAKETQSTTVCNVKARLIERPGMAKVIKLYKNRIYLSAV